LGAVAPEIWGQKFFKNKRFVVVYAVVRAGGRQEKVQVGTIVTMNRIAATSGTVELPALLLVDGEKVTTDPKVLSKVKVVAEVLEQTRGPKIVIQKYKNKTGYKKRQGHRQDLTVVKVTEIK
jgi:large subunit ribosomal protein L21